MSTAVNAQHFDGLFSYNIKNNNIELDITKIQLFEHRVHFIYTLTFDERFDVSTSSEEGVFTISQSNNQDKTSFIDGFNSFCDEEYAVFNSMSKEESGFLFNEWKSALPESYVTSLMMDIYAKSRQNNLCANADPFCTDNGQYMFPAGVDAGSGESGPNYDCLSSTPNPAWYYMRIGNPGSITIHMSSDPNKDIDFCCWGPFTDPVEPCPTGLTANKVVSCSYSSSFEENCLIPQTSMTGEYYILVITNYSNAECNISFSKTGGTGTTDCSIMPPVLWYDNACYGGTMQLNAQEITGATYSWNGPNGFTSTQGNPSIPNVTFSNSGTYSCSITVGGQASDPMSIIIDILPSLNANFSNDNNICVGVGTSFTGTETTTPAGHNNSITERVWDFGDGTPTVSGANVTHTYNTAGTYTVTYTIKAENQSGAICEDVKTKTVTVNDLPNADAGNDININFQNQATLTATTVNGASYMWQPAEKISGNPSNQTVITEPLTESTTFTLTVTKNGCSSQDQVTVYVGDAMTATATIAEDEICEGNSTTVSANAVGGNGASSYTYSWEPASAVDNPHAATTAVHPLTSTTFVCTVSDGQTTVRPQVNLTVNPAQDEIHTISVCPSELPYILELPDGTTEEFFEETGASGWHKTVQNQYGCNVNVILYLTINDIVENVMTIERCNEPYTFVDNGVVIKTLENTCVFDSVYPFGDCQKHITIYFTRNNVYDEDYEGEYVSDDYPEPHCYSYTWTNGITYDTHGDYPWTFSSVNGCDSIVTLHLDEHNLSFEIDGPIPQQTLDTCKNSSGYFLWGGEAGKKVYYGDTINGSRYDSLFVGASAQGCDSIGHLFIRLYSHPHVNSNLDGEGLVIPGVGYMPYIYEYNIQDLYGAGVESDHPADYTWEVFSFYKTPNRLYPEIEDNYESSWFVHPDQNNKNRALVYVNEEGNALLKCTITTICGTITTSKFIYTEGWQDGESVDENSEENMISIFPNPTDGDLYIGYKKLLSSPATISIYSYSGDLLDEFYTNSDITQYSTNGLSNGLYFIRISGKDFVVTKKFVLNR